jgi:hypothetical protein
LWVRTKAIAPSSPHHINIAASHWHGRIYRHRIGSGERAMYKVYTHTLIAASYQHRRTTPAHAHGHRSTWNGGDIYIAASRWRSRNCHPEPQNHREWGRAMDNVNDNACHAQNGLSPHHATAPSSSHHVNIAASHLCSHKYRHSTNGSGGRAKTMSMTMFTTHTTRERWPPSDSSHLSGSCSNPTPVILHMPRHTSRSEHPLGTSTI